MGRVGLLGQQANGVFGVFRYVLAAAMLPCICGVMCGITPPLGLGMYAGMTIAESDFSKTFKNNLWWVVAQFSLQVAILMGWLPILGL